MKHVQSDWSWPVRSWFSCRQRTSMPTHFRLDMFTAAVCLMAMVCGVCFVSGAETVPGTSEGIEKTPGVEAKTALPSPIPEDGEAYPVSKFVLRYSYEHPQLPSLDDVMQTRIVLGQVADGYVAPRDETPVVEFHLADLTGQTPLKFHATAIRRIDETIVQYFNARDFIGVFVAPDPADIDEKTGEDRRPEKRSPEEQTMLHLIIYVAKVTRLRTVAFGKRIPAEERIDHPAHAKIKERSPVKPATGVEAVPKDVLRKDPLDDYIFLLNRHRGRHIDASVSSAGAPGEVALDFLINENKPWLTYFQISNTGTEETNEWRERFGFTHNQLTGHDDIFSLDYITAGFDASHAIVASYEAPVPGTSRIRWRAHGTWSRFDASEVGAGEDFNGRAWSAGGEVAANIFQHRQLFLDLIVGARWHRVNVENETVLTEGTESFFLPNIGLRLDRETPECTTIASLNVEGNLPGVAGTDEDKIEELGRLFVDDSWVALQWQTRHSFYLEPLLLGKEVETTLAHEISLSFRGQHAFGDRLIPQFEEVIGGLYTVRGYDESVAAGDTALIGSLEYAYHIPRAFRARAKPAQLPLTGKPFRFAPQTPYGRPDWDLILRPFFDIGRTINSDRQSYESNETLVGAGLGVELMFLRNLNVRCDWGIALRDARDVDEGDSRFHIVATILF